MYLYLSGDQHCRRVLIALHIAAEYNILNFKLDFIHYAMIMENCGFGCPRKHDHKLFKVIHNLVDVLACHSKDDVQ